MRKQTIRIVRILASFVARCVPLLLGLPPCPCVPKGRARGLTTR